MLTWGCARGRQLEMCKRGVNMVVNLNEEFASYFMGVLVSRVEKCGS